MITRVTGERIEQPLSEPSFSSLSDALAWLDSFIDFESNMPSRRAVPTLERMWTLMRLLGDPQEAFKVVHLTGTNGKGSAAAMVSALLSGMGLRVGIYTSPNLARVNERLACHGRPIDDRSLSEVLGALSMAVPLMEERPTRFELLTAAALRWFADEAVDVAVVEVGLGGTWDATNVVHADVAVLTNISFDHTEVLGPTLEGIAADKAGIVKAGSRVVVGETDPELVEIVRQRAEVAGAVEVWVRDEEFACAANHVAIGGRLLDVRTPASRFDDLFLSLHGAHQGVNAACALAATEAFFDAPLPPSIVRTALGDVHVPGRLEVVGRRPLWLLDGAHNVAGMSALADALVEEFHVDGERVAVVGMLRGRDPTALLDALRPSGMRTVVACAPDSPRAWRAEIVAQAAGAMGLHTEVAPSVTGAVSIARSLMGDDGLCVVTGSLYVVSDARMLLLQGADTG